MRRSELIKDGLVNVAEAGDYLGLGRSKLYDLMAQGELSYVKIGGARRIPRKALEELAARHLVCRDDAV